MSALTHTTAAPAIGARAEYREAANVLRLLHRGSPHRAKLDRMAELLEQAMERAPLLPEGPATEPPQQWLHIAEMAEQPDELAVLSVAELLRRAERDSDPVSCFTDGTDWSDAGAMALIVKPGHAKAVHDLLAANGFITPGKPVADAQQPAAEAAHV